LIKQQYNPTNAIQNVMASNNGNSQDMSGAAQAFGYGRQGNSHEEQPSMRSVAVVSQAPSVQNDSRLGKAPLSKISYPTPIRRSTSITVKQVWNEENWKLTDPLDRVPIDFPLERTHREIHGVSANDVANRISKALRLLSVDAVYDGEKAKVKCTTCDCVSFRIRLFAGGEDGSPVVVEVQRRNGSASSFMRVCRKILDGAEGSEIEVETNISRKNMPPFMTSPIGAMKCLQGLPNVINPDIRMNAGLEKSIELLRSKQKDTNILGLENLCHLTDPLKTRPDLALKASKAILLDSKCSEIREEIGVMLQKDAFLPEEFDNEGSMNLHHQARRMTLVLLSNVLVLTSKDGCLDDAVKASKWFSEFLIPSLLDEVKGFESSANNSYEAACGLTGLATCSELARRVMEENSAVEDLRSAYFFLGAFSLPLLTLKKQGHLASLNR